MKVLVINGPNLNMLGRREVAIYGSASLEDIAQLVRERAEALGLEVEFFQSNHEGELIDRIQACAAEGIEGIVFNPGGYTHSSVALRDALLSVKIAFVEVHISNPAGREDFRRRSYFSDIALGTITGLGPLGYALALEGIRRHHEDTH